MKLLKIERPATKNLKVARILFMVMTVLFAVYICPMCHDDFVMAINKIRITKEGGFEYVWSGTLTYEAVLHLIALIYYIASTVVMLILSLRCTVDACGISFGLGVAGALFALVINSGLAEFMVYRYGIISFLYNRENPWATGFRWIKPIFVALMIAAATYFLIARLRERKITESNTQSAVTE